MVLCLACDDACDYAVSALDISIHMLVLCLADMLHVVQIGMRLVQTQSHVLDLSC
jgi:hypothetical protein